MKTKNSVIRSLNAHHIPFTQYELPVEKLSAKDTAKLLQVPEELVYKSIVVTRPKPGKAIIAIIPGSHIVNLKAIARLLGEKKVFIPSS